MQEKLSPKESLMPVLRLRFPLMLLAIAVAAVSSATAQTTVASQPAVMLVTVSSSQPLRDGIELQAGPATVRITALRDDIIRVRIAPGALPEDASWAVLPEPRGKFVDVKIIQDDASVGFRTASLEVRVE